MIQHADNAKADNQKKSSRSAESACDSLAFRGSSEPSVGIELELAVVDRDTGELAPGSPRILAACRDEKIDGVSAELMQSMIEVRTCARDGGCADVREARDDLLHRLRRVRNIARSLGYNLTMLGTHPSAKPNENVLYPDDRYTRAGLRLGWMIYHRVTFGLHVHVGVRRGDDAVSLINLLVQYLPHVLALSSNSPFWQGIDTGLSSSRAMLYGLVPRAGIPPHFRAWKDFRNYCQTMRDCSAMGSHRDVKWDIRPRPDFGTIEFRVCDMPQCLSHAFAIAALMRSMVIFGQRLLDEKPQAKAGDERRHWVATENRWLAARYGLEAMYISAPGGQKRQLRQEVGDLMDRLLPVAQEYGDDKFLSPLRPIEKFESGAQRQRRLYRDEGKWQAVIEDSVKRLEECLEVKKSGVSG